MAPSLDKSDNDLGKTNGKFCSKQAHSGCSLRFWASARVRSNPYREGMTLA
jgi:hypothetical protein